MAKVVLDLLPSALVAADGVVHSQMLAHFVWTACATSHFFNETLLAPAGNMAVLKARKLLFEIMAELLERLAVAPAPLLALPITFLLLAVNSPAVLENAPVERLARGVSAFGYHRLSTALLVPLSAGKSLSFVAPCLKRPISFSSPFL